MLADVGKRCTAAKRYWFRVLDLDATGIITEDIVRQFYDSQVGLMVLKQVETASQ